MPIKNSDLNELSNRIYEFVCSLLEDEIEPNEIGAKRIARAVKRYINETGILT